MLASTILSVAFRGQFCLCLFRAWMLIVVLGALCAGMNSLCLVSAVDPLRCHFLDQTASSVQAVVSYLRERGLAVEWSLCVDGPGQLPRFRTAEYVNLTRLPVKCGAAAARNAAAMGTRATWVMPLDVDDTLNPASLADVLTRWSKTPRAVLPGVPGREAGSTQAVGGPGEAVQWVVSANTWWDAPGTASGLSGPVSLRAGAVADAWSSGWPVLAGNLIVRREALMAAGGWPAMAIGEDVALWLRVSELFAGVVDPAPVWRRRRWEGSVSAQFAASRDDTSSALAWAVAQSVTAQRQLLFPDRGPVHPPV